MAFQKNFVVKNGIEVNDTLIFADKTKNTVGIGTTLTPQKLQVSGGIGATSLVLTDVGTIPTLKSTDALISNGYINVGLVTSITGTGLTYTTGNFGIVNADNVNAISGVVTNLSGTISTYTNSYSTILNAGTVLTPNLYAVNGITTNATITNLTGVAATFSILNATNANILSGIVTNLSGNTINYSGIATVGSISIGSTQVISSDFELQNINSLDSTTIAAVRLAIQNGSYTLTDLYVNGLTILGVTGIGTLNVSGISTLGNLTVTPAGLGATVGSYTGVVTYYGDAAGLYNLPPSSAAGTNTQVQYNNAGSFAGSDNFIFNGFDVVVGSAVTINSTGIVVTGIASATGFAGTFSGTSAVFSDNSTDNIVRITQTGTGNALVVEDSVNPDATPFVVTGIGSVGIGTNAPINTLDVHGTIRLARQDSVADGGEIVFARSSDNTNAWAVDVYNNDFRVTDNIQASTRIHIGSGGNVGLGSTATSRLHVFGNAIVTGIITATSAFVGSSVTLNSSGIDVTGIITTTSAVINSSATIGSAVVGSAVTITSGGVLTVGVITATDFNSTSDINLKENITTVDNALGLVNDLRGVRFEWKKDHKPSYGVIAQELEQILPELVTDTDPKTVNYNGIIGVLIEAVKELSVEVENLKSKLS